MTIDLHNIIADFPVNPGTLSVGPGGEAFAALYREYSEELSDLCRRMEQHRQTMLSASFSADFSDRESEMAYILVRALQPDVIVEISPRHGYSTNYLLAGLTRNGHGKLFSYEIETHVNGIPIEQAIRGNLLPNLAQQRFELIVGDAMTATIPAADLLFVDSCHEAYFAAWYAEKLVPRARFVMTHDILVRDPVFEALVPKAAMLGIHEQYYLLESLATAGQGCFAAAQLNQLVSPALLRAIPPRNPLAPERAIVYQGHAPTQQARALHTEFTALMALRKSADIGDSLGVFRRIRDMLASSLPLFIKLEALRLIPAMGYKMPLHANEFPAWAPPFEEFSVANMVQYAEYRAASYDIHESVRFLTDNRLSRIHPEVRAYFGDQYGKLSGKSRLSVQNLFRRVRHLLKKRFQPGKIA